MVDFVLELAQVTDQPVTPEELAQEPDADGAGAGRTVRAGRRMTRLDFAWTAGGRRPIVCRRRGRRI